MEYFILKTVIVTFLDGFKDLCAHRNYRHLAPGFIPLDRKNYCTVFHSMLQQIREEIQNIACIPTEDGNRISKMSYLVKPGFRDVINAIGSTMNGFNIATPDVQHNYEIKILSVGAKFFTEKCYVKMLQKVLPQAKNLNQSQAWKILFLFLTGSSLNFERDHV